MTSKLRLVTGSKTSTAPLQECGEHVIARLEELLEMTKEGNISNLIIVATTHDNHVLDCWANRNQPFHMIAGLESIKMEFMQTAIKGRRDV